MASYSFHSVMVWSGLVLVWYGPGHGMVKPGFSLVWPGPKETDTNNIWMQLTLERSMEIQKKNM